MKGHIMAEEEKNNSEVKSEKECNCCCYCKEIKKFLGIVLASFIGCLIALLVFGAVAKPKFPPPMPMGGQPQFNQMHHGHFDRHPDRHFKFKGENFDKKFEKMSETGKQNPFND